MASINPSTYNLPSPSLEGTPGGIKGFISYYLQVKMYGYEVRGIGTWKGSFQGGLLLFCHLYTVLEGTGFEEQEVKCLNSLPFWGLRVRNIFIKNVNCIFKFGAI